MARCICSMAVVLLFATASCTDSFKGRYLIESLEDRGASVSGFIDFDGQATDTFKLGDPVVSGFSIVVSGHGVSTLTYDSISQATIDNSLTFNATLGAPELVAEVTSPDSRGWSTRGDLDGQDDGDDFIFVGIGNNGIWRIWIGDDDSGPNQSFHSSAQYDPPSWKLVLEAPDAIPETGTLALSEPPRSKRSTQAPLAR